MVAAKMSGHPQRTVDCQHLNPQCLRGTHHTPFPFDMVSGVPLHSYKTVADAFWGFHQVEIDEYSRRLNPFIIRRGRYQYHRTPMSHCSASEAYTRRFDDANHGISREYMCVDDASIKDAFWHSYDFLETCAERTIALKPEKFPFCKKGFGVCGIPPRLGLLQTLTRPASRHWKFSHAS